MAPVPVISVTDAQRLRPLHRMVARAAMARGLSECDLFIKCFARVALRQSTLYTLASRSLYECLERDRGIGVVRTVADSHWQENKLCASPKGQEKNIYGPRYREHRNSLYFTTWGLRLARKKKVATPKLLYV